MRFRDIIGGTASITGRLEGTGQNPRSRIGIIVSSCHQVVVK